MQKISIAKLYFHISLRSRLQMIEDTYKNRETQIKEENEFYTKQLNERAKIMENEKSELILANKERITTIERNKEIDIERIKALHKKVSFHILFPVYGCAVL